MAGKHQDLERTIIPRWRSFDATALSGELGIESTDEVAKAKSISEAEDAIAEWNANKTIGRAIEATAASSFAGIPNLAASAAEMLDSCVESLPSVVRELAKEALIDTRPSTKPQGTETPHRYEQIRKLKAQIKTDPRSAIHWVEISRIYTILGQTGKAENAIRVAQFISPENRFVARSACRLYLHLGELDQAIRAVQQRYTNFVDPWLLAAEIAVSQLAQLPNKQTKRAVKIAESKSIAPINTSELNSALGSIELSSGSRKKSRIFFKSSLEAPTENSIAQAAWASRKDALLLPQTDVNISLSPEAQSWDFFKGADWTRAYDAANNWLADQPFSSRPAAHGGFIASVQLLNFWEAYQISKAGLVANPNDAVLLNNAAFAAAQIGRVDEAVVHLNRLLTMELKPTDRIAVFATAGLIALFSGELGVGRSLYNQSFILSDTLAEKQMKAIAMMFHSLAEFKVAEETGDWTVAIESKQKVCQLMKKNEDQDLVPLFNHLQDTESGKTKNTSPSA